MDLRDKRILVTGGHGFLGQHVVETLRARGCSKVFTPTHADFDLINPRDIRAMFATYQPEIVIHMAAVLGGIGMHIHTHGKFLYENLTMGLNMMEIAREYGVEKFVNLGTACSYSATLPHPVKEEYLWSGFPEKTTSSYGIAKLVMLLQGQTYREQYGMNCICLIPANVYGPKDATDPKKTHIIPALIVNRLQNNPFVVWGTGRATREFIYATDCAEAIVLATETYNSPEPINIGTGVETPIATVARMIAVAMDYKGEIVWDLTKPDGHSGRVFDVSRAQEKLGWKSTTSLQDGLKLTVDWYVRNHATV